MFQVECQPCMCVLAHLTVSIPRLVLFGCTSPPSTTHKSQILSQLEIPLQIAAGFVQQRFAAGSALHMQLHPPVPIGSQGPGSTGATGCLCEARRCATERGTGWSHVLSPFPHVTLTQRRPNNGRSHTDGARGRLVLGATAKVSKQQAAHAQQKKCLGPDLQQTICTSGAASCFVHTLTEGEQSLPDAPSFSHPSSFPLLFAHSGAKSSYLPTWHPPSPPLLRQVPPCSSRIICPIFSFPLIANEAGTLLALRSPARPRALPARPYAQIPAGSPNPAAQTRDSVQQLPLP
jgi:hypothetical protein